MSGALEAIDPGIKYKMREKKGRKKAKQLANTKRQPPTYAIEAFIGNLTAFLLNAFSSSLLVFHAQDVCHSDEDWKA